MAEAPIKFRCYRCNKPLGAPARKAGAVVNCPQCGSELQIPAPDAPPADPGALGSPPPPDLATLRPEDIRVEPEFADIVTRPRAVADPVVKPEQATSADIVEEREPPASAETVMIGTGDEVVLPPIRVEPPSLVAREAPGRAASEVVLAPAVVLAWSLLVLLAVPLAFLAGLLTGHFLWK